MPVLKIDCRWGENEKAQLNDAAQQAADMLEAAGLRDVTIFKDDSPPGPHHSRDGHGAHGTGPEDLGAQRLEPVAGTCPTSSSPTEPA